MNNEQPNVVGAGTKSCGVRTSVNKEYWKSKAASNSFCISLRGIRAYGELQLVVTEVGQVKQTVTLHVVSRSIRSLKPILYWYQPFLDGVDKKKKLGIYSEHCVNKLEATWIEIIQWQMAFCTCRSYVKLFILETVRISLPLDKRLVHRTENFERFIIVIV